MKTKLYFLLTACAFCSSLLFTSCHNSPKEEPSSSSTIEKMIVSNQVQTLQLNYPDVMIYQDFNHQYFLGYASGDVVLTFKALQDGGYSDDFSNKYSLLNHIGLKSVGKVNSIEDILFTTDFIYIDKDGLFRHGNYFDFRQPVQPNYGYLAKFSTDNGVKYVRIFLKSYVFSGDHISEITIEFQELMPE